jgi:ACT domain-containing protein
MEEKKLSIPIHEVYELKALLRETCELLKRNDKQQQGERMTPAQVIKHLGISRSTYERYKQQGVIKFYPLPRNNGKYEKGYYLRSEIDQLLADGFL